MLRVPVFVYCFTAWLLMVPFAVGQATPNAPPLAPDAAEVQQEIREAEALLPKVPDRGAALFLLAHDYARVGSLDRALSVLTECISLDEGFDPEGDAAFDPLKNRPEFQQLVERVRRRYPRVHQARAAFELPEKDLIPEGLAADPKTGVFYMGSLHLRKIVKITPDGKASDFVKAGQYGPICGLKVDPADESVWANVCPADGAGAELLHFDGSGKVAGRFPPPTPGRHLFNDLILRNDQEIYLTDSLANRVYGFDRESHAFAELPLVRSVYYPNGIALSNDGNLLYVADAFGIVQVDLRTRSSHEVDAGPSNTVSGADGLYWYHNSLGLPRVAQFHLSPDRLKVTKTDVLEYRSPFVALPTTGAIAGSKFYFM